MCCSVLDCNSSFVVFIANNEAPVLACRLCPQARPDLWQPSGVSGLKTIFSLSQLVWVARQSYSCGGVMEEAGGGGVKNQGGISKNKDGWAGCVVVFVAKPVWWWAIAKMASLSSPFLPSHLPLSWIWKSHGNETRSAFRPSWVAVGEGVKVSTTSASWINLPCSRMSGSTMLGKCVWWQMEGLTAWPGS